ncbi:hypothetical protein QZH41_020670 [Actinostola sp. cb2023]|nr:hypothetical protein QZH41_020670 [Actinostola sp. cb2023]
MVEMCKDKLWCHTPQTQPQFLHNFCRFFDVGPNGCYDVVFTSDMRTITVDVIEDEDVEENFDSLKTFLSVDNAIPH